MIDLHALALLAVLGASPAPATPYDPAALRAQPASLTAQDDFVPTSERVDALAIYGQFRLLASQPLWPGFEPLAVPLAVYDGDRTVLISHPNPPEGFEPVDAFPGVYWIAGPHEDVRANTSVDLGGARTATLLLDADATTPVLPAAVLMHEAFHVYNDLAKPNWQANEGELFQYPIEDSIILELRRFEVAALRRAEGALAPTESRGWAQRALRYREERHALLPQGSRNYERDTERYEGLARYLQDRCIDAVAGGLPEEGFAPGEIRARCYATGSALARLLDRTEKGWREAFAAAEDPHLDETLRDVLGEPAPGFPPPDFSDEERQEISDAAVLDAAHYRLEQKDLRKEFQEREGWILEIHAPDSTPLFPQGFDPMNVKRLGKLELLHERWLKVGNLGAELEIQGLGAITYGAGEHPIYQGVARVLITGIPEAPRVERTQDGVSIDAVGLRGTFGSAAVSEHSSGRKGWEIVLNDL